MMDRPSVAPESSSMVLVSRTFYNARGEEFETTDPAGLITHSDYDDAGRQIRTIQNYQGAPASSGEDGCCCGSICGAEECACPVALGDDVNLTVETSYTADCRSIALQNVFNCPGPVHEELFAYDSKPFASVA